MAVEHAAERQAAAAWREGSQECSASMAVEHAAERQAAAAWREGS